MDWSADILRTKPEGYKAIPASRYVTDLVGNVMIPESEPVPLLPIELGNRFDRGLHSIRRIERRITMSKLKNNAMRDPHVHVTLKMSEAIAIDARLRYRENMSGSEQSEAIRGMEKIEAKIRKGGN